MRIVCGVATFAFGISQITKKKGTGFRRFLAEAVVRRGRHGGRGRRSPLRRHRRGHCDDEGYWITIDRPQKHLRDEQGWG
jgi:hypothetical protein